MHEPFDLMRVRDAHRRGDHGTVLAEGPALAQQLAQAPATRRAAGEVLLMMGAAHAAAEHLQPAREALEAGLAVTGEPDLSPAGVPLGRRRDDDWARLLLLDLDLVQGAYDDALRRLDPMLEPGNRAETRFGALRAQAAVATARGEHESAHLLLNTASTITRELRSRLRASLVEGDRAILLALQGRLYEAVTTADRVLESLTRSTVGPLQAWGGTEGAAVAFTLARLSANAGDLFTAQRLVVVGQRVASHSDRAWLHAHRLLAEGALLVREGDETGGEASLRAAGRLFEHLGCAPGAALALQEQGRLAWSQGLVRSARPLFDRAAAEFARLGQAADAREARRLRDAVPTGA